MSLSADSSMPAAASPVIAAAPHRIGAIDAFRGLVMLLMMAEVLRLSQIAKALPQSAFWNFLAFHQSHVPWAGCSLHDLIQPSFSFLVGVSLPFSIASREAQGQTRGRMLLHAVWRGVLLVLLGVFLRSMGRTQTNWTFEDTLSQIGFGYVPLFLLGLTRQRWQWVALVIILVGYWGAFALYPLPPSNFNYEAVGVPADWPYHYSGFAAHWNKNSNLAWAFDTWFLNLFPRKTQFTHNAGGYATLSFIPTLGTMILGLIAGGWLRKPNSPWRRVGWFVAAGIILLGLGLAAHGSLHVPYIKNFDNVAFTANSICPCVKRIWTPSWTLYSGGWCFVLLAGFYALIDAGGWAAWSFPLRVIGANSIVAYCLAHGPDRFMLQSIHIHFGAKCFQIFGTAYEPLVAGMAVLAVEWLILYWLYRQRIHVRI